MALNYYDILNIITKCASQNNSKAPQQSQGSQAMMAAAQAAKPSGEPMLNLLNYGQEEEEDNNTQEDSANLKELERLKEENIKLREDISKKEIEMYQAQAQTQILNKEKESLDRIQKQKYDLQKMQVNADAEKIKHQAELEKITAAEELKAQQAVSKQLIDLNKQYIDQKIKNDQALRQQSDRMLEQTRKQIEQEREKFNQERTGLSPALKTDLEAAIQALDKIPIPGQDISLKKSAFINTQQYVDAIKNAIVQSKVMPQEVKSFIQSLDPSMDMSQALNSVLNMLRNNPEALREGVKILNDNLPTMWTSFVDTDAITQMTNGAIKFKDGFPPKAYFNESYSNQNKGNAGQVAQSTGQSIQNQQSSQNIQTGNQPTPSSQSLGRNNSTPQVAGTQNNTQALGQQNNNGQQSTSTVQGRGKFSETLESGLMTFGPIATALTGIPLLFQNKQQSMHTSDLASNSPNTMLESFEHTYKDPRITRRNPSMGSVSSYTPGASLLRQHMVANNSNP